MNNKERQESRREFVKKAAYVAPMVLSLSAVASVAKAGSGDPVDTNPEPINPPRRKKRR